MSIAKHTVYNVVGALVPTAVAILTVPIYLKTIGIDRYGVLALCWLMLGYFNFLSLGLGPAVTQNLASQSDRRDASPSEVFWTALWLNIIMGMVGAALIYIGATFYFESMENFTPELRRELIQSTPLLSAIVPIMMVNAIMASALQGRQKFLVLNSVGILSATLIGVIPLVISILFGPHLFWLITGTLCARILSLIILFSFCVGAVPVSRPNRPSRTHAKSLISFGGWVTISSLINPLLVTVDRFAIGNMLGPAAVSLYTIPHSLVSRIALFPQSLASALFPRFASTGKEDLGPLEREAILVLAAVVTPATVLLLPLVRPFLDLWVGADIGAQSSPVAYIVLGGLWMNAFAQLPYVRLQAAGRPDLPAKIHMAELVPYGLLLTVLLSLYGLFGAALAWTVRVSLDAIILFVLAGTPRRSLTPMLIPAALVVTSVTAACLLDYRGHSYWIIFSAIAVLMLVWSVATVPRSLRKNARSVLVGLKLTGARQ